MALAARAERRARNDCDTLLLEQPPGERLGCQGGRPRDLRKGVERAARLERRQADLVQPAHDQLAALVVLCHHLPDERLTALERLDRGRLAGRRRGHDDVLVNLAQAAD